MSAPVTTEKPKSALGGVLAVVASWTSLIALVFLVVAAFSLARNILGSTSTITGTGEPGGSVRVDVVSNQQSIEGYYTCSAGTLQFVADGQTEGWSYECPAKNWGEGFANFTHEIRGKQHAIRLEGNVTIPPNAAVGETPGRLIGRVTAPTMRGPWEYSNTELNLNERVTIQVLSASAYQDLYWKSFWSRTRVFGFFAGISLLLWFLYARLRRKRYDRT